MARSKSGNDDSESRARESQRKAERHVPGFFEFRCDECGFPFDEKEMKIQHGLRLCNSCYEPNGDVVDRDEKRAYASKYAANLEASRKLPKYPFALETAPWAEAFVPNPVVLHRGDIFDDPPTPSTFVVIGGRLDEVTFGFPIGVTVESVVYSSDKTIATFTLVADSEAVMGDYPISLDGSLYHSKIRILENEMDPNTLYLRLDGANNGTPLVWITDTAMDDAIATAVANLVANSLTISTTSPLQGGGALSGPLTLSVLAFGAAQAGVVPASGGGISNYLRADGTWAAPAGTLTDLGYTASTRVLTSSSGADVTLPLVASADAGLAPASGGGTTNFLRADGTWTAPGGVTNLGYTASTRILTSDTGTDVTLPLFSSTEAGLVAASGGGTDNFLRADGTWALPPGAAGGAVTSVFTRTGGVVAATGDYTVAQVTGAAPLASPTFTGVPAAPTAAVDTNTTQLATTAFVIGQTYAKLASPTFTGVPAAPTAAVDTNTTQLATTAYVVGQSYLKSATAASTYAPLASPTFTGVPAAPTAAVGTNTTQLATTAFVIAEPTRGLKSATTTVSVSAATAPTAGQVLKATAGTTATWQSLAAADVSGVAPLASPTFTGVPAAPTAAADTNTTQLATTAYVIGQGYAKLAGASTFTGAKTFTGNLIVGSAGATIKNIWAASTTWNPGNIVAATQTSTTVTVTGAAVGDIVIVMAPSTTMTSYTVSVSGVVTSANTVTIFCRNVDTTNATDPPSDTWLVMVFDVT